MKPVLLGTGFCTLLLVGLGAAWWQSPRPVTLDVHAGPVTFFDEARQGIDLAALPRGIAGLSAAECGRCHEAEYAEWKDSGHAHARTEPVFAAAFRSEPRFLCRGCHAPLLEQQPVLAHRMETPPTVLLSGGQPAPAFEEGAGVHAFRTPEAPPVVTEPNPRYRRELESEGVTCVTCHVREGAVLTAKPTGSSRVPHPLHYSPEMASSEYCAGCHQFQVREPNLHPFEPGQLVGTRTARRPRVRLAAAQDPESPPVPPEPGRDDQYQLEPRVQHTLDEFRASPAAARGETCQSCHMPREGARGTHRWPGRSSTAMLKKAVRLEAELAQPAYRVGDRLQARVRLVNTAGHAFPTGDSVHAGILDVWLRDGERTVARAVQVLAAPVGGGKPQLMAGMAQATVRRAGHRRAPTTTHAGEARLAGLKRPDTRLRAGEEVTLSFTAPLRAAPRRELSLRVRLFHAALHPAFRGSRIDPGIDTSRLVEEVVLPVRLAGG